MELNFTFLVVAALMGMIAKRIVGWNPWELFGSLTLLATILALVLPWLALRTETDPQAVQTVADSTIAQAMAALPSVVVGELAGIVAARLLDAVPGLPKGPGRRRSHRRRSKRRR